jgi:hypothetical protein
MKFQLLLKTLSSLENFKLFVIIAHKLCTYGDAQDCEIYTPMLWYDIIKISNSIMVTHLVAPFSMVGPRP